MHSFEHECLIATGIHVANVKRLPLNIVINHPIGICVSIVIYLFKILDLGIKNSVFGTDCVGYYHPFSLPAVGSLV